MALLSAKAPFPTSQYAATYRVPASSARGEHHGFFASPTESEFSEHFETAPLSVKDWDEKRVAEWLRSINCGQYIDIFTMNNINGQNLMELDRDALRELGVRKVGDQIRIANQTKSLRNSEFKRVSVATKNRVSFI